MERKLVKQGNTTLMVSLPHCWIDRNNLQKGGEVSLKEEDNSIVISTAENCLKKKRTVITLTTDAEPSIRTAIINAYRSGYDVIRINFKCKNQYKIVNQAINDYTIGLEMIKQEGDYCILENITEPDSEQFEVLLRRIFYNIIMLIELTENRLKGSDEGDYKSIVLKIHQYDSFCRRVISKKNLPSKEAGLYWLFFSQLAQGQRELYYLNKFLDENEIQLNDFWLIDHLKEVVRLLREGYVKKDLQKIESVHSLKKEMRHKMFYPSILKGKDKENVVLYHLASSIRLFYLGCSPVTGLLLNPQVI